MPETATDAKNRPHALRADAKADPAFMEKGVLIDTVMVQARPFDVLRAASEPQTLAQRLRIFEQKHTTWIEEQNTRFEKNGLWCDGMRVW